MTGVRGALWLAIGAVFIVVPFWSRAADAAPGFLGFQFNAHGDGLNQTGGSPSSQGYPQVATQSAHTTAHLETGPNGSALASTQWPGDFVGNLGSLAQVFGAPESAGDLNYPVRAEASSSGTQHAKNDPGGMTADADGPTADARVNLSGAGNSGLLTFGNITANSHTALEGDLGVAKASVTIGDVELGGGTIKIDSIVTDTAASTDGKTGTATGHTIVSGAEVAGQPVTIDEKGVHVVGSNNPNPADAAAQALVDNVLSNFKQAFEISMYTTPPLKESAGARQAYSSGALVIKVILGGADGGDGAFVLGGADASVQASNNLDALAPPVIAPPVVPPVDLGTTPLPSDLGSDVPVSSEPAAPPETTATTAAPVVTPTEEPISFARFAGISWLMPWWILLGSLIIGRGLHLLHQSLVNGPTATACIDQGELL